MAGKCVAEGMHGRGACVAGGHDWQGCVCGRGTYMAGGVHGMEGVHGRGACMVGGACMAGGMCGGGVHGRGCVW